MPDDDDLESPDNDEGAAAGFLDESDDAALGSFDEDDGAASAEPGRSDPEDPDEGPGRLRARRQKRGPWGRLAERWVPEPLRDSRVDPGRRGALVLTIVAAVAAIVAAVGVWRNHPEPRPVATVALSQAAAGTDRSVPSSTGRSASVTTGTDPAGQIIVSVTGLVLHPGLVRLKQGTRVADAIAAAGGTTSGADLTGVNLAAKLVDGQSVVISAGGSAAGPVVSNAAQTAGSAGGSGAPVNLNTADVATLDALPGVGPVTAANIVAWRDKNGQFATVDQLQEIPGIGPAKFAQLAPLVTV